MVTDEDDDRASFARNVVQCVSLAVGGRKPELRRRRIKNDLSSCCRHIAPPCPRIYVVMTARRSTVPRPARQLRLLGPTLPFPVYPLTAVIWTTAGFLRCGPAGDITPS